MDHFWVVTLFHFQPSIEEWKKVENLALEKFSSLGIEEFSLSEEEVDNILGDRSYSGGDLPQDVLDEVEEHVLRGPVNYRFFFDNKENAELFKIEISQTYLCEVQVEEKDTQDWNAEWKKHYSPIKVNDLLEIVPSWEKNHSSPVKEKIFIYPGMGFGTGSHETTYLCLKLFTENLLVHEITSALDFGSGSGILGLSMFKFFPDAKVDFYDIDLEANKNCYVNAEINQLENKSFRLLLPEVRSMLNHEYDLVFANILENILVEEVDPLISHTRNGGHLIVSGLLKHQAPGIIKLYTEKGVKLISHLEKGDWTAILFQKEKS